MLLYPIGLRITQFSTYVRGDYQIHMRVIAVAGLNRG